jgi:hypothetical protein
MVLDDQHSHRADRGYAQGWVRDTGNSELKRDGNIRICLYIIPQ